MTPISARWRAAAHAVLLAGAATLAAPTEAQPPAAKAFAPPCGNPLILSRKVVRELAGGGALVATRRYRVTFSRVGDGWEVNGSLIASEIEAPPVLAPLAALERDRPDDGLFPIHLDGGGRIVAGPAVPGLGRETVAEAVGAARQLTHGALAEASRGFIEQVGAAAAGIGGGLTRWPEALFLPNGLTGTSEQAFTLPDGSEGTVQVTLASDPAPGLATMGRAERSVVTMAAGTRRVAREEWTLAPPAAGQNR